MQRFGLRSRIEWIAGLLIFACVVLAPAASQAVLGQMLSGASQPAPAQWLTSLAAARTLSRETGKPILVDLSATWCGPCQAMIHETFPSAEVQPLLHRVICVRIDVDADPEDAQQFQVDAIPRILLLNADSNDPPRMDVTGYEDDDTFANGLRAALGMPAVPGSAAPTPAPPTDAETVTAALESNTYAQLKAKDKSAALSGLHDIVAQLGGPPDTQVTPIQPVFLPARAATPSVL